MDNQSLTGSLSAVCERRRSKASDGSLDSINVCTQVFEQDPKEGSACAREAAQACAAVVSC